MDNLKPRNKNSQGNVALVLLSVFVVLGIVICGVVVYKHQQKAHAIAKERMAYSQAEKDLDATAAKIIEKFGKPDDTAKDKSCGYTSNPNEFDKGDLYCYMDNYLIYQATDQNVATSMTKQVEAYLVTSKRAFYYDQEVAGNKTPPINIAENEYSYMNLDCSRSYIFSTNRQLNESGTPKFSLENGRSSLLIDLNCGSRPAKAAYYPIKN